MRCYRCGNVLSENDFCTNCSVDVSIYKKIVRLSNTYYNNGLERASQRDLSGAADMLRRSIKMNKNNIKARNLLGLVYFEMGEVVQAMAEWVISKNIKPERNLADVYISTLQSNPNKLDTINQTIRKYNIALGYAKQGSFDVAVIQLKKLLNVNPNLIKGHQLLALLYINNEQYEKARRAIKKALKIDKNNILSNRYLAAIEEATSKGAPVEAEEKNTGGKESLSGFDVIIPSGGYRESNHGAITVLNVVIGIFIGIAATYFLLTPAKLKTVTSEHNSEVKALNAKIDSANADISDLERQIELLNGEKKDIESQLSDANNANDAVLDAYDNVISAAQSYIEGNYKVCAEALSKIDEKNNLSGKFNAMYKKLKEESYKQAAIICYNEAVNKFYNAHDMATWTEAVKALEEIFKYDYLSTNYYDAADKLCNAYIKLYDATTAENPDAAKKTKKKAISSITNMIDTLGKVENVSEGQLDIYRNYLADLTARP